MSAAAHPRLLLTMVLAALLGGCAHLVVLHDPLSASEHNDLGVVYEANGQLDAAAKQYRKALRMNAHDSRARVNLGNIEAARTDWKSAEKHYRMALRDSSTSFDAMNNLAIALLRQNKRLDEARTLAERAAGSGSARDSVYKATLAEVKAGAQ